jgi:hypothetical protein
MVELDKESLRRLDTWISLIARGLRPDAPVASTADGLRLGRKGSLSITAADGWYDHEAGKGGRDALSLIRHLRGCSAEAAVLWAREWLEQHPGDGALHAEVDAEAAAEASARRMAWATHVLDDATDPLGTLDSAEYERERVEAARKHTVRRSFLDDAWRAARTKAEAEAEGAADDPPYHQPVTDLAAVLDAALVEVQRYVVGPDHDLATAVVWSAHAPTASSCTCRSVRN